MISLSYPVECTLPSRYGIMPQLLFLSVYFYGSTYLDKMIYFNFICNIAYFN